MEIPFLQDMVIILGLSVIVILLFQKLKMPNVIGFLLTGAIAGPYGFSLIHASHEVEIMAEIGVILLLFIIGIEFSLKNLVAIKKAVFVGGGLQVLLTILATFGVATQLGYSYSKAIFMGFLFSLSSTAIVLKMLQDKGAINSPHGKTSLAVLIFQDIIVVPMMLFTPIIANNSADPANELLWLGIKALGVVVLVILSTRYIVPRLLYLVGKTKSRELFILTIVVICFSVAWLTSKAGLSLALGAFLAGLIISDSEYSYQATSNILPFREIFTSFFFISIGMLLNLQFLVEHIWIILLFVLITFFVKGLIAAAVTVVLGYPLRTVVLVGLSLFQVGEFAFILSKRGIENGLLEGDIYQYFLAISILTMAATPYIIMYADKISGRVVTLPWPNWFQPARHLHSGPSNQENIQEPSYEDHLVIIGFGINGKNLAKAARHSNIPYIIIEMNAETVRKERLNNEPIIYGDAMYDHILHHVQVHKARVVVIAISDPEATKGIITAIREQTQKTYVIVRTRFVEEMEENYQMGADEVIPEEFETSIEIFTRVLTRYLVPRDSIEEFIEQIRAGSYEMLRSLPAMDHQSRNAPVNLPGLETAALTVQNNDPDITRKPLKDAHIRGRFGINIVAIKRNEEFILDIHGETTIKQDDILYVFGRHKDILEFEKKVKV